MKLTKFFNETEAEANKKITLSIEPLSQPSLYQCVYV